MKCIPADFEVNAARSSPLRGSGGSLARGFTMIEVLLAIAIFSLLAGVITFTMFGSVNEKYLSEGSQQFETVLRMTRAEAANTGRRMRVGWSAGEDRILVLWEPQPLAQPGQFVEYTGSSWESLIPNNLITVVASRREGATEEESLVFGANPSTAAKGEAEQQTIVDFYPDGSTDSTTIELASRDVEDLRRAIVEMDGLNYFMTTRIMGPTELSEWRGQSGMKAEMSRGY